MAKVYSWQISSNQYAYIADPDNLNKPYVGMKLSDDKLKTTKTYVSTLNNDEYITRFEQMSLLCSEMGYIVTFEDVENYLDVKGSCDNLQGKPGRGIKSITQIDYDKDKGEKIYAIWYDDDTSYDTFTVYEGRDGQKGEKGDKGADGDKGVSSKLIMIYKSGKDEETGEIIIPDRPQGGKYDFITNQFTYPEGWSKSDDKLTPPIWMSSRTFTSTESSTDLEWSIPMQISGEDGSPGSDGSSTEFIYCRTTGGEPGAPENSNEDDHTPTGWSDNPSGVTEDIPYEWVCIRRKGKDGWGLWSKPSVWSKYGANGQDGDGIQYIYKRTKEGKTPDNPTPSDYLTNQDYIDPNGEYCPTDKGWTDDPTGVDIDNQFEWVSSRKFCLGTGETKEKSWQPFSAPTLWAKFGENGKSATAIRKLYAMNNSTSTPPTLPTDNIYTGDWGSGFPVDFKQGENVVWCTEAEIWADSNEFVKSYVLASTKKDDGGNVEKPFDATDENTKTVEKLPSEKIDDENIVYLYVNGDYYKWKEGWCEPYIITGLKGQDGNPINYSTYVFGYGYEGLIPNPPSGTSPDNPGSSTDSEGNTIIWLDFPNTNGDIDVDGKEENGKVRRWYQSCGSVFGRSNLIDKWGIPFPCNSKDGKAGKYTEFRFGVTDGSIPEIVDRYERNNPQYRYGEFNTGFWLTLDTEGGLPQVTGNSIMWQIMAVIDSETNEIEGGRWSSPVRITGEKGEPGEIGNAGIDGVAGVSLNQRYCLGTSINYFGSEITVNNNDPIPVGWYKGADAPYTTVENLNSHNQNLNLKVGSVYKINNEFFLKNGTGINNYENITSYFNEANDYSVYIWCTQGTNNFELVKTENGQPIPPKWVESGYTWDTPFKLQGTNGLRGADGSRGQVIYPMGVYNPTEVYVTTESRAPYVYDSGDGLYYVLKIVNTPWVGDLPDDYKNIKVLIPNGANNDNTYFHTGTTLPTTGTTGGKKYVYWTNKDRYYELNSSGTSYTQYEKYKYQYEGNWISNGQGGQTPAQNYAKNPTDSVWERFETFEALFAKIGIISNGMIGSAVYNNEFMFSQQGKKIDGSPTTYDKTPFLNNLTYIEDGYTSGGTTFHWKDENGTYVPDENANPYYDNNKYSDFIPNICMNFKTGQMWGCGGNVSFNNNIIRFNAKNVVIDGNLNVNGFMYKTKTKVIYNPNESNDYFDNNIIQLDKTGTWIEFHNYSGQNQGHIIDIFLPGQTTNLDVYANYDYIRKYYDTSFYIYNYSINSLKLKGIDNVIANDEVIKITASFSNENNTEKVEWKFDGPYKIKKMSGSGSGTGSGTGSGSGSGTGSSSGT